jgi:hypothetical protein
MQDSVLETLLVEDYTNKISAQNFTKLVVKFGSKAEFLKGYDAGIPKISKLSRNFGFEKKFSGGSLRTGGVAGIRAMVFFSPTYFGEISIFGLSKDPATRI